MAEDLREIPSRPSYLSYLLRIWSKPGKSGSGTPTWRASVETPLTQEQRHFSDLESLFTFLLAMTGQPGPDDSESQERGDSSGN
ncbi:MAG: hypothetical protein ACJ78Q_02420 [Chloroflexia bacterium]